MPHKWMNRIMMRCSSNAHVAISLSQTLLEFDMSQAFNGVGQCCQFASLNLKDSHVFSNTFHVSICFHSREKINNIYYFQHEYTTLKKNYFLTKKSLTLSFASWRNFASIENTTFRDLKCFHGPRRFHFAH